MANKSKRKWNRVNYFAELKSTKKRVGHPVYVYGSSGLIRKFLVFSSDGKLINNDRFEKLNKNIDPNSNKDCFVKKNYNVAITTSLETPKIKYVIDPSDKQTINKYKK